MASIKFRRNVTTLQDSKLYTLKPKAERLSKTMKSQIPFSAVSFEDSVYMKRNYALWFGPTLSEDCRTPLSECSVAKSMNFVIRSAKLAQSVT